MCIFLHFSKQILFFTKQLDLKAFINKDLKDLDLITSQQMPIKDFLFYFKTSIKKKLSLTNQNIGHNIIIFLTLLTVFLLTIFLTDLISKYISPLANFPNIKSVKGCTLYTKNKNVDHGKNFVVSLCS